MPNRIQGIRLIVLTEIARATFKNEEANLTRLAQQLQEFGILQKECERYLAALLNFEEHEVIKVVEESCRACKKSKSFVTEFCVSCLARSCEASCRLGAISFEKGVAIIDPQKCVDCKACAKACKFNAIRQERRPCESACMVGAIEEGEEGKAKINCERCVFCTACMKVCPFGAMVYSLEFADVIEKLKKGEKKIYAMIAPSIEGQFGSASIEQIVAGLLKLGFFAVRAVARGAQITAKLEARQLIRQEILVSSCCPAFFRYIDKYFPEAKKYVSGEVSPMVRTGMLIKELDESAETVFIGPCVAKKHEAKSLDARGYVDNVITFEELFAMFSSQGIEPETLAPKEVEQASELGWGFRRSGGLVEAVSQALLDEKLTSEFKIQEVVCGSLQECKVALSGLKAEKLLGNFIEGMVCRGGCVNGAACLGK